MIQVLEAMQRVTRRLRAKADPLAGHGVRGEPELPTGADLGFMEYSDWLAGCSDKELYQLSETYGIGYIPATFPEKNLTGRERHEMGKRIWEKM